MAHLNIEKISMSSRDREKEEQKKLLRRKNLFILINCFLEENGLLQTANVLKLESNFPINDFEVCDNIHLETILQDFESYYFLRYQKLPNIVRKVSDNSKQSSSWDKSKFNRMKNISKSVISARKLSIPFDDMSDNVACDKLSLKLNSFGKEENKMLKSEIYNLPENCSSEWQYLSKLIMQDFNTKRKEVQWTDIIGLEKAKEVLKEAIIYPIKYKELFSSSVVPWKSILLYGPTGTGKTSLALAVASESKASFFNVCISTLTSRWRGESEKLVKVLFDLAKSHAPSIIFIDEIDSLMSHRGNDHEASRRMKTEFFSQMDSLQIANNVFVLAATNMPWELDQAVLRRMEKRLLIPLPDAENRLLLFKKFLPLDLKIFEDTVTKTDVHYENLAAVSENYSASDIELVCKETKMGLIRQVLNELENFDGKKNNVKNLNLKTLRMWDVLSVLKSIKPSNENMTDKYNNWKNKFSSE